MKPIRRKICVYITTLERINTFKYIQYGETDENVKILHLFKIVGMVNKML